MKAKVYFSKQITPKKVVELYKAVGLELPGKVAVKVHSGEPGNQNFLMPEFWQPMVETVHGTIVECNTAYPGERNTTDAHRRTMIKHGWSKLFDVDILDAEGPDLELPIPNGKRIQKNLVGKDIKNYDSMLVLSHFKGHPMGGFGGALKQLSIGCASSAGKANIHGAGKPEEMWTTEQNAFLGRRGGVRRQAFRRQDRLHQRDEEHVRRLRLLRRGGGPVYERYRHSRLP